MLTDSQQFRQLMWHTFASTRGGPTRIRIVRLLTERPYNSHQLCGELGVDYRTVIHHMKILLENQFVKLGGRKYGGMYFLTEMFENENPTFEDIVKKNRSAPEKALKNA